VLRREAVAWQTEHQRTLEVDPIVPSNHGGTGDLSNLQASTARREAGCVFCALEGSGRALHQQE
jgi:hypothetical protein